MLDHVAQRLQDHRDVCDVVLRYARAVDRMDWELLRSCYHSDAIEDHGTFKGGIDEFVDFLKVDLLRFQFTTHYIMNQLVEFGGDLAWAESYCYALHRTQPTVARPTPHDWEVNVRYIDRMERRDGQWRIADRQLIWEGGRFEPVPNIAEARPLGQPGRRDRADVVYDRSRYSLHHRKRRHDRSSG